MQYFGPKKWGLEEIPKVETPAGDFCMYCEEYIDKNDYGVMMPYIDAKGRCSMKAQHRECFLRQISGSVLHQRHQCGCFGYDVSEDQPNMTRRQAAVEAVKEYEKRTKNVPPLRV